MAQEGSKTTTLELWCVMYSGKKHSAVIESTWRTQVLPRTRAKSHRVSNEAVH